MKTWKKNLVAFAILLTVCGGIYANWHYTENQTVADLTDTLDSEKILSEDMLVMADGAQLPIDQSTVDNYFAAVRLSRQEARDGAVAVLQEAMAYSDGDAYPESSAKLDEIVQTALCEAQIESLVVAKGYTDCVAYISDNGVSVAVAAPEGGMQEQDVAVVADIVMSQSDFTLDDIRVVEVQ